MTLHPRRRSVGPGAVCLLACVLLAGCERVEVEMSTTFRPDGSGQRRMEVTASGSALTLLGTLARSGVGQVAVEPGTDRARWQHDIRFSNAHELAGAMPSTDDLTGRLPAELPGGFLPRPDISFARENRFIHALFYYEETYPPPAGADRLGACPTCRGTGRVPCLHCRGTGRSGGVGPAACASCSGSGRQPCHVCGGSGANPVLGLNGPDDFQPSMALNSAVTMPGRVVRTNGRVTAAGGAAWELGFSDLESGLHLTAVSRQLNYLNLAVALAVPLAGIVTLLMMALSSRRARSEGAAPTPVGAPQAPAPAPVPETPPTSARPAPAPALDFGPASTGREPVEVARFRELFSAGHMQEAALAATEATHFYPDDSRAWTALAQAHLSLGRVALAESAARRALQLTPDRPAEWFNLGVVLRLQGSRDEALEAYRRCLALDPQHTRAATEARELLAADGEDEQDAAP